MDSSAHSCYAIDSDRRGTPEGLAIMADNPFLDELALRWEDEGFAARDIDGQLIRRVDADQRDYNIFVDVTVDGLPPVKVRNADYLKDSQGNIVHDAEGRGVLRYTTIYDAVRQVYG